VYVNSLSFVPMYSVLFLLLIMVENYAFYGSDGPVQKGFVPPSFEEMSMALINGGTTAFIQPLNTRATPTMDLRKAACKVTTKKPMSRENFLFWIFGFRKTVPPEERLPVIYEMEFPYSRRLKIQRLGFLTTQNLESRSLSYPRGRMLRKKS